MNAKYDEAYVCAECFGDEALQDVVREAVESCVCSFCGEEADEPIAAPVVHVTKYINACLYEEYDDAANCLPYESAEGGFFGGTIWTPWELLDDINLDLPRDEGELRAAIAYNLDDITWCERNPFSLNNVDEARYSWDRFSDIVKHRRRYFFLNSQDQYEEALSPGELLEKILESAAHLGLLVKHERGNLKLFRARFQRDGKKLTTAKDLGPPTESQATQSNRMSPAGVVMFYASDTVQTAVREAAISREPGTYVVATFVNTRGITLLDLANLPPIPSLFQPVRDSAEFHPRKVLQFLHEVASALSEPVARDGREHIEYVPSQVVTEFVRSRELPRIDGVVYRSAVDDGNSFVLFAEQDNLLTGDKVYGEGDRWLELVDRTERVVSAADLEAWRHLDLWRA